MKVKGVSQGMCFGVGFDSANQICSKLCALSKSCALRTKEFLLRERDEVQRQNEGVSSLRIDYSKYRSKRKKMRDSQRERDERYAPDMPDFYSMTAEEMEPIAESRGLKLSEEHLALKNTKPHLYRGLLLRRLRATYLIGKRNSKSNDQYQEFLKNQEDNDGAEE